MAPLPRTSPILSAVARARVHRSAAIRPLRVQQYATARTAQAHAPGAWGAHWNRAGGTALMYFPVVAVVMFWPYAVEPIMNLFEGI